MGKLRYSTLPFTLLAATLTYSGASLAQDAATESATGPAAPEAVPVQYSLEGDALLAVRGEEKVRLEIPPGVVAIHRAGNELYLARGEMGVAVYGLDDPLQPRLLREIPATRGAVTGFHQVGDQVWMEIVSRQAVPVAAVASAGVEAGGQTVAFGAVAAPVGAKETASESQRPAGPPERYVPAEPIEIRNVAPGVVELGVGANQGVKVGDRFSVFRTRPLDGTGYGDFVGEELVAVAEVTAVKAGSSLARLGRGETASETDTVRPANAEQTQRLIFPRRLEDMAEVSVMLRPLVKAGTPLGGGVLCDLSATYFGSVYYLGLRVQPLGLGWTDEGNVVAAGILAEGGYDGRAFGVGLGAGVSLVNGDMRHMLAAFDSSLEDGDGEAPQREWNQRTQGAFTLSQQARLGARDGLNLTLTNLLLFYEDDSSDGGGSQTGFIYGGTFARFAIPVGVDADLLLEGGGGVMGYWYASIGVFSWLVGNGSPGSLGLSVSAGGAGIEGSREVTESYSTDQTYVYTEDIEMSGPMVSAGMTYRFGF
jgi:hypothetical protein